MVERSTLCRPDSNLNGRVAQAPTARRRPGPGRLPVATQCSERVDGDNEVGRRPPGPAYGPVVYFAPQHDPTVKHEFLFNFKKWRPDPVRTMGRFVFFSSKSLLLAVCGLTLTRIPKTTAFCCAGTLSPKARIAATSHHFAWSKTPKSGMSLTQRISQCFGSGNSPISSVFWRAAPAIASAAGAGILWRVRTWQGTLHTARMCTSGTGVLHSAVTHGKVTKPHYERRQRGLPSTVMKSGNANDRSTLSLAPSDVNGIFAVDKPRNWTSFDVVNKIRSTLGAKLREENPSLTPKQCRIKVRSHTRGNLFSHSHRPS
jgi:hypothetical protein